MTTSLTAATTPNINNVAINTGGEEYLLMKNDASNLKRKIVFCSQIVIHLRWRIVLPKAIETFGAQLWFAC